MDAMVEALKPFIIFAMVLWGIETVVTMLIKDHKQAKRKRAREKRRLEYQDRHMANDVEHAKVTRGQCATTYFAAMISIASAAGAAARTA